MPAFFGRIESTSWFLYGAGLATRLFFIAYLFFLGGESMLGNTDVSQYEGLAKNIVLNHAFSLSTAAPFVADGLRTPGYPLFLALSFALTGGFLFASVVQAFLGAFIPVLIRKIGLALGISSRAALLAAVVSMIDLNFLSNTASIQTEALFMPLFLLAMLYVLQTIKSYSIKKAIVLGTLFGVLALIRPVFLYVAAGTFFFIAAITVWRLKAPLKKAFLVGGVGIAAMTLVLSPWLIRNHQQFGTYDLSSIGPVNMYTRLAVGVLAIRDHVPEWTEYKIALHELALQGKIPDLNYPDDESALYDIHYNKMFDNETIRVIKENPLPFLKLQANSVFAILTQDNTLNILKYMQIAPANAYPGFSVSFLFLTSSFGDFMTKILSVLNGWYIIPFIGRALWALVALGAFVGSVLLLRKKPVEAQKERLMLVLSSVAVSIVVTLPIALSIDSRMRVPIEPFLLLLASYAFFSILSKKHV